MAPATDEQLDYLLELLALYHYGPNANCACSRQKLLKMRDVKKGEDVISIYRRIRVHRPTAPIRPS